MRENKNKFVMAFLALLVEKDIFVEVSFDAINILAFYSSTTISTHPVSATCNLEQCVQESVHLTIVYILQKQIQMGFLMVGHTHEDIDQGFSCLSRHLQKMDAMTVSGMYFFLHFSTP